MAVANEPTEEEQLKSIQTTFDNICNELSVDKKVADIAWRGYDAVKKQCMLEGDQVPWLACSIYVACWLCPPPTVSEQGRKVPPLTIVETCKMSIIDFFEKLQKWVDMANMSKKFQDQVIKMESAFAVTSVIFKKFEPIFEKIFANVVVDNGEAKPLGSRPKRGRRSASTQQQFGSSELMEFCWLLYIYSKRCFVGLADDIMNSYHMLLCALDMVYVNLIACKRKDLLSTNFAKSVGDDNTIIEALCREFEGILLDAKHMRVHWWNPKIKAFLADGILQGDAEQLTGMLSTSNFESNLTSLHDRYEEAILKRGDMDERVFIPKHSGNAVITTTPKKRKVDSDSETEDSVDYDREMVLYRNVQACLDRVNQYQAPMPFSSRAYSLPSEPFCPITPAITQNAAKLQSLVADCTLGPNPELKAVLSLVRPSPTDLILRVVQDMSDAFMRASAQVGNTVDENFAEFASYRRDIMEMLYYRILERIIQVERERQPNLDLGSVMNQDVFHKSLFACATELVLFSYNCERLFPWILQIYDLQAYHFYKIIELIIRAETDLSREMVKHLNAVEEKCLEEFVWTKQSVLWEILASSSVPSCDDVLQLLDTDEGMGRTVRAFHSYDNPVKPPVVAKRRLDFESTPTTSVNTITVRASTSSREAASLRMSSIQLPSSGHGSAADSTADDNRKATSKLPTCSLSLFFRKVYYMGSLRMNDICERLRIGNVLKQHSWSVFGQVLEQHTELMKGRHLDQMLMCSIYIIGKIMKHDVSFQEIMCCYRCQPQAKSRVYRNVLLDSVSSTPTEEMENREVAVGREKLRSGSTLPVPAVTSAPPTPTPTEEEYGDLIKFYNQIFVTKVEEFAKQLSSTNENNVEKEGLPMSPLPSTRLQALSPRRRIADAVFVSPMKLGDYPPSPSRPLRYSFSRSPYKDLRAINNMIRAGSEHTPVKSTAVYAMAAKRAMSTETGAIRRYIDETQMRRL